MSLSEVVARVAAHEKTLVVVNPSDGVTGAIRDHFGDRNVRVESATTPTGPSDYMVLGENGEFLAAAAVDDLLDPDPYDPAVDDRSHRPVLDALDETMFTAYGSGRMVAASREIEDRAWRVGTGELHACFQFVENLEDQREVYERLGGLDGLDVHAYAAGGTAPAVDGVSVHCERDEELRTTWVVAFDGGDLDESKCALLAEEREGRSFYGFWTYDPGTVDYIVDHLRTTYVHHESGGDQPERKSG